MVQDFIPKGARPLKMAGPSPTAQPSSVVPMQAQPLQGQGQLAPQMGGESCPSGLCDTGRIPRGAKPVRMAGPGQQQQQEAPQMGCGCTQGMAARTIPEPEKAEEAEAEVHVIRVEGLGSDGQTYVADVEVGFPVPARVMGVRRSPVR